MSTKIDSAAIASLEYTQILEIRFKSGATYRYFGVPEATYNDFMVSNSKGRFFVDHVKDRYRFDKVHDAKKD